MKPCDIWKNVLKKGILITFRSADCIYYSVYEFIGINEITIKTGGEAIVMFEVDGIPCENYCMCGTIARYRGIEIKVKEE